VEGVRCCVGGGAERVGVRVLFERSQSEEEDVEYRRDDDRAVVEKQ